MTAAVETMAYTNEVPWHGLGVHIAKAPSVEKMLKLAKLDWSVEKLPMFLEDKTPVPDFFALTRDSDKKILDVCGNGYVPVQNVEAFAFFKEFVEAGKAKMETAGSLRGGRHVWGLANLGESFTLSGGDKVKGYLLVAAPHEVGKSFVIKFTPVRVVCNNTLTLALRNDKGHEFRMSHRRVFDDAVREEAKVALGIARDQMGEFEKNAKTLLRLKLSKKDVLETLIPIFTKPSEDVKKIVANFDELAPSMPRLQSVMDAYVNAPGATPGNGWGVLNAVTYYADHIASRTPDKRLSNAWFGKAGAMKVRVLDTLLEMAA